MPRSRKLIVLAASALLAAGALVLAGLEARRGGAAQAGTAEGSATAPGRSPGEASPAAPVTGRESGFAGSPARLATVPAGHELGEARFSADGRHVAFVATKDGQASVFLDATRVGTYQDARGLLVQSGQGGLAFAARRAGRELVVVDGHEGPGFDEIGTVRLAPDGRAVYSARSNGRWVLVSGAVELAVPGAADPSPVLSADGRRVAFVEERADGGKSGLRACSLGLTDCAEGGGYDGIASQKSILAGGVLAFVAGPPGRQALVTVDLDQPGLVERTSGWLDEVLLFALSDGGAHQAYLGKRGGRQVLVRDGQALAGPELDSPLELLVSSSGRVLLTAVVEDEVLAYVDGVQLGEAQHGIHFPVFGTDGFSLAFVAERDERNLLVVNGEPGPRFDKVVTPAFTPDGTRVVYRARERGERFVVVADAHARTLREHPHHEAVYDVVIAPDSRSVGYGVRSGPELWWKVERL